MSPRVNYVGLADRTGYGCAAAQYLRALRSAGAQVCFQPLVRGPGLGLAYECGEPEPALLPEADCILHAVPEYYPALTGWLRARGATGRILGMTVWETTRLPRHWPALLNALDAMIVPSDWNRSVFQDSGVSKPVHVVPHLPEFGGAPASADDLARLRSRLPELAGKVVFYSIADWNRRKGNDLLVRAFQQAFAGRTDVLLVLKTTPDALRFLSWKRRLLEPGPDVLRLVRSRAEPQIVLLTDDLPPGEIAALHTLGDCYVSCTRGEGWGMGIFEAAFYARPIVAPALGGHRAYLQPDSYSGLVPGRLVPVRAERGQSSYTRDQMWVETSAEAVAHRMRQAAARPEAAQAEAAELAARLRAEFTAERTASMLGRILGGPSA